MSKRRIIAHNRLTAPAEHLGLLIEPSPAILLGGLLDPAAETRWDKVEILDSNVSKLRESLRRRLKLEAPIIATGHQCEFFHAGVFAKIIATQKLAERAGGSACFLAVDSDVPKSALLAAPRVEDNLVKLEKLTLPACDQRLPFENQPGSSKSDWLEFISRIPQSTGTPESALPNFIAGVRLLSEKAVTLRGVTLAGLAGVLKALNLPELPVFLISELSATPEFRALFAQIALNARRFANEFNAAQCAYRRTHQVRNPRRPAPLLAQIDDRTELPYWIFRRGQPRRRLFTTLAGDRLVFHADNEVIGEDSASRMGRFENHRAPWSIEREGWQIRPRALMLSAGARLLIADLFIHGIGGAKYDEMTEAFSRRFFGADLPPIGCVSATAYADLPLYGRTIDGLREAERAVRDIRFNPQRYAAHLPTALLRERSSLIEASDRLHATRSADRTSRREIFKRIRAVNGKLLALSADIVAELESGRDRTARELDSDRLAREREYFFALLGRETLFALVKNIKRELELHP